MAKYSATIQEASKDLSAKERIALKDTTTATKLDEATKDGPVEIYPEMWAILNIHNDKAEPQDYENYILMDMNGEKYVTGSQSFWNSFMEIYEEMAQEDEDWGVKVYRMPSKNYAGRDFLTCAII